jgi:hypothetical protein
VAYPTDGNLVYRIHGDTGNDLNGGGIFGAGTFIASPIIRTDIVLGTGGTLLTSAAIPFTSGELNHTIYIASGTGFTVGTYLITAVSAGVATIHASAGTNGSTGGAGRVGGFMRTLGLCAARLTTMAAQFTVVKCTGNFTESNTTQNTANGPAVFPQGTQLIGYHSTEDDSVLSSTMLPVITKTAGANANNAPIGFTGGLANLISSVRGFRFEVGPASRIWTNSNIPIVSDCWFVGSFVEAFGRYGNCVFAGPSFYMSNAGGAVTNSTILTTGICDLTGTIANCLIICAGNTGVGDAYRVADIANCTIVMPGVVFNSTSWKVATFTKCLFYSTDSVGSVVGGVDYPQNIRMLDCAYNVAPVRVINERGILYSGDPFVNRAGGNYALKPAMQTLLGGLVPIPGVAATNQQFLFGSVIPQAGGLPMIGSRIGKAA